MTTLLNPVATSAGRRTTGCPTTPTSRDAELMTEARNQVGDTLNSTVYVIEDDEATRIAVSEMLQPSGARVKTYESAEAFLQDFVPNGPACLLLDENLPGINGSQLLRQLSQDGMLTPAVVVTAHATTSSTVEAMRHGALTVLEKPCSNTVLQAAVNHALDQDTRRIAAEAPKRIAQQRLANLTSSELQVLGMVLDGVPNKQIASRLGVCVRTVESRRSKVYQTAKVNSVAELVRLCVTAGMVQ